MRKLFIWFFLFLIGWSLIYLIYTHIFSGIISNNGENISSFKQNLKHIFHLHQINLWHLNFGEQNISSTKYNQSLNHNASISIVSKCEQYTKFGMIFGRSLKGDEGISEPFIEREWLIQPDHGICANNIPILIGGILVRWFHFERRILVCILKFAL